jgi:hypothetical protein
MVRTKTINLAFGHDLDGDRSAMLKLASEPYDDRYAFGNNLRHWAEFIGIKAKDFPRDSYGRVTLSPEQQLDSELDLIERLAKEVFHDPEITAKAVRFIDEMNEDYNARYSG